MEFLIFKKFGIGKRLIHPKPNQLPLLCTYEVELVEPYIYIYIYVCVCVCLCFLSDSRSFAIDDWSALFWNFTEQLALIIC